MLAPSKYFTIIITIIIMLTFIVFQRIWNSVFEGYLTTCGCSVTSNMVTTIITAMCLHSFRRRAFSDHTMPLTAQILIDNYMLNLKIYATCCTATQSG